MQLEGFGKLKKKNPLTSSLIEPRWNTGLQKTQCCFSDPKINILITPDEEALLIQLKDKILRTAGFGDFVHRPEF
jgi:hypothetical protein